MLLLPLSSQIISASSSTGQDITPISWALEAEASGHMGDVIAISHSADGRWLATAGEDERVLVWDRQTWEVVTSFDCGVCWGMWDVEFSPDSTMLAATSDKGGLWVWDTTGWERVDRSAGREGRSVVFSPDSSELIMTTRGTQDSAAIVVMDTTDWHIVEDISLSSGSPYSLTLSPDGEELAIGHTNGSIGVWNTAVWTRTNLLEQHASQVTAIDYSPNGSLAASGDFSSTLRVWNTADWSLVASDDVSFASIHDLIFTDEDSLVMAYGGDLGQWTADPWSETVRLLDGEQHQVRSLDLSPDGNELVVGGESGDDLLRRISLVTGEVLGTLQAHAATVRAIAISTEGTMVATADENGLIVISNAETLEVERTLQGDGEVGAVAFSPDGGWLYALTGQGRVHVWDTTNGEVVANLSTGSTDLAPDLLDLSSDGSLLAAANLRSSSVTVWHTSNWTEAASLSGVEWPQSIQFSPDDATLAVGEGFTSIQGGQGQVHLWSTENWTKETTITGFEAETFVRFAPDGTTLWISTAEGDWWDQTYVTQSVSTADWTMMVTFTNVHRLLGVSPDGSQLLHADCGGTLVDTRDGTTIDRCIGGSAFSISTFDDTGTLVFGTAFPGVLQRIGGDNDADGVPDVLDTCAETPPNVAVDDAGCIISEADSDGDGVVDAQDLCPLTRSNEPVDDAGCAARQRDGDDDGVNDLEDDCPSSSLGSTVDADGCVVEDGGADTNETNTTSDTNDSDADGVIDSSDQCEGFDDSIDVDEDGIPDGCDQLIDSDGDGLSDSDDQCQDTAGGATIDGDGCSDIQRDSDGDGYPDVTDLCDNTPKDSDERLYYVEANGCATFYAVYSEECMEWELGNHDSVNTEEFGRGCPHFDSLSGQDYDDVRDTGMSQQLSSGGGLLWKGIAAFGILVTSIIVFLLVRRTKDSEFNEEEDDDYLNEEYATHAMPVAHRGTPAMPQRQTGPDTNLQGVWGDDGYEWIEHPEGSEEWYWRDADTGQWVKH